MHRIFKRSQVWLVLLLLIAACSQASDSGGDQTLSLRTLTGNAAVFGTIELVVDTGIKVANPYDPDQMDLMVSFISATGQIYRVPAFWYQDFDQITLQPKGNPEWRVRFTPSEPGAWQVKAELTKPALSSDVMTIEVSSNKQSAGFVRINSSNPRYFARQDGSFFMPIGLNLGWPTQQGAGILREYEHWFDQLSKNGGNIARIWMASWSFGIEWQDTGLGDYSKRMQQAWMLDQIFKLAEQRNITIMLTLINHGAFSTSTDSEWDKNPYNAANGGPIAEPQLFATDLQARELFKHRVRYIAARWAHSPSLFAWEWWNEANWTPINDALMQPWVSEMTRHLAQFDPYQHLVSTSYASNTTTSMWTQPEINFTQHHDYTGRDLGQAFPLVVRELNAAAPQKPALVSELGYAATGRDEVINRDVWQFHQGLWAAPFSGFAGSGMYWWWDTLVDPDNLWSEYNKLAQFFKDQDLTSFSPVSAQVSPLKARALALQTKSQALVWVRSNEYEPEALTNAYEEALKKREFNDSWKYVPPTYADLTLKLSGLEAGTYQATWYDPQTGTWSDSTTVTLEAEAATIAVPSFNYDLALKLVKQ
ncbi:DUF5060 domain-containing protein [Herpetosiphon llansteffanensis]|uniref:DUF5060 domain-containing protein n=1 Tax=Herpetosiphon llansteffanensis TaxID=2094568 RepID=UPI000D7C26E2|nr:DUF5060 domain-containing protein [Herpetosiphon llansteffanensis]